MFNDDIQGTGSVTLSCLLSATRAAGIGSLKNVRVLCAGAGSAGLGVCQQIVDGMIEDGLPREEAMKRFAVMTMHGALGVADGTNDDPNHNEGITEAQEPWVHNDIADGTSLIEAIKKHRPNVLLGLSTAGGLFTEEVLKTMAEINEHPIIMPMSNPTSKAECTAEAAYRHTNGKAIVASGSPFEPVTIEGMGTFTPSQCNNMYIFPGIGLACSVAGVKHITDRMLYLAAQACTDTMTQEEIDEGRTFPNLKRIREVSLNVAVAVIEEGVRHGLCPKLNKANTAGGIENLVRAKMYYPVYVPLVSENNTRGR